jgi:hypothetical protein
VAPPSLGFLGSSVHWRRALPDRVSTGVCQWPRIGPRDVSQGDDGQRCESGEELLPGSVPVAPSRFHRFHCHLVQSAFRFVEEATVRPIHESSSWPRHNLQHRLGGVSSRSVRVIASKPRQPLNPLVTMECAQTTGNQASSALPDDNKRCVGRCTAAVRTATGDRCRCSDISSKPRPSCRDFVMP